jgi:hypothetical protein
MTTSLALTPQTKLVAHPEQLSSDLDGETILLHMTTGLYYGMNDVATRVWSLLQTTTTLEAMQTTLLDEYDVAPEVCGAQLNELVTNLVEANLVQVL